jgi:hypothetical protein
MSEAAQRSVAAAAQAAGIRTIAFPVLPDLGPDMAACDYHPSLADNRKRAEWLTAYLEAHPELWQGE